MKLRNYAFPSNAAHSFLNEDVYAFLLRRYVAMQMWRVEELFVPGIVTSTLNWFMFIVSVNC